MSAPVVPGPTPPTPPWHALRDRLLEASKAMAAGGEAAGAALVHAIVESWWQEQRCWDGALRDALMANHEINNALVGVSGNVQLLLMSPVGREPAVRERLETVLREAGRVERATRNLAERKAQLGIGAPNLEEAKVDRQAPAA